VSLHRTGQWYKKIRGKFHYFGKDKDAAIKVYEEQATYLHTGKGQGLLGHKDTRMAST
jgi:hypothetical protein